MYWILHHRSRKPFPYSQHLTEADSILSGRAVCKDEVDLGTRHGILRKVHRSKIVIQKDDLHETDVVRNLGLRRTRKRGLLRLNASNGSLKRNLEENVTTTTAGESLRSRQTGRDVNILRGKEVDRSIAVLKINLGQRKRIHEIREATFAGHVARQNVSCGSDVGRNLNSVGRRIVGVVELKSLLRSQACGSRSIDRRRLPARRCPRSERVRIIATHARDITRHHALEDRSQVRRKLRNALEVETCDRDTRGCGKNA